MKKAVKTKKICQRQISVHTLWSHNEVTLWDKSVFELMV